MHSCKILTKNDAVGDLTLLCLGAHPDDIEIGCGGSLLKISQEHPGAVIHWVVLGAHGARAEEARMGAQLFRGISPGGELIVKDFRDGFFPAEWSSLKEFFETLKERFSPSLIFTHCRADRHQDHRIVSDLTWNTWRHHTILEYEVPKWDGDLGVPNGFIPLTRDEAESKTEKILSTFVSQRGKPWFTADTFLGLMRLRGNECRAGEGFAEAFHARKLILL